MLEGLLLIGFGLLPLLVWLIVLIVKRSRANSIKQQIDSLEKRINELQIRNNQFLELKDIVIPRDSSAKSDYIEVLNAIGKKMKVMSYMGNVADIQRIEHFETYVNIASNKYVKFTLSKHEQPGATLVKTNTPTNIKNIDYNQLLHLKRDKK